MDLLTWPDNDNRNGLPGILSINNMTLSEFQDAILRTVRMIRQEPELKVFDNYYKYDIINAIISRMQNNRNLKSEWYIYLTGIMERLWDDNERVINYNDLKRLLG